MDILFVLLTLVGLFLLLVLVGGLFLPRTWVIEKAVLIHTRPNVLYPIVGNLDQWSQWMTWVPEGTPVLEKLPPMLEWSDNSRINGRVTVTVQRPPNEIHYHFEVADGQLDVFGTLVIGAADPEYTQLAWRCQLQPLTDNHPIRRYQAYFLKNYLDTAIESSLQTLLEQFKSTTSSP